MIDNLFDNLNSLNFYLILIIVFILYLYNKKQSKDELNKVFIDAIGRRSEECPQIYPNGWLPVYDSHDLKKGQVKPIFALGRDLVIYRGTTGKVYIFDAYCPHLGANLGVGGTVVGDDMLKCHFHGWQFNNQGDCTAIPGLEEKSIPKASIRKWRCDEVNDFIWVWHHSEGKEPDWFIYKFEQTQQFKYRGKSTLNVYGHVQDITENEADLVHFQEVHLAVNLSENLKKILQKFFKVEIQTEANFCDKSVTHRVHLKMTMRVRIGFINLSIEHSARENGPAMLWVALNQFNVFLSVITVTVGPFKQLIHYKIYSEPTIGGFLLAKIVMAVAMFGADQDLPIWNTKRYLRNPTFTKLDETIIHSRRWFKQFYQAHSKDD